MYFRLIVFIFWFFFLAAGESAEANELTLDFDHMDTPEPPAIPGQFKASPEAVHLSHARACWSQP